ncbi:MAG: NAD(P)-dependent oxidoreductase [bacterium]|nr:NAD(P)-dependent oxidoreductase [bacterium]
MKAVFFETTQKERPVFESLINQAKNIEFNFYSEKLSPDSISLAKEADIVSVFVNSVIDKELIDQLPNLKFIATRSTGFDHIDIEHAKNKNIKVSNVSSYGSHTVAEFAFGLILTLSRKIFQAHHQLLEGNNFDIARLEGFELYNKTLGVAGTGRIGKNVIRIAKGFGMKVLAFDAYPDNDFAKEMGFEYTTLINLLNKADVVTLHLPYNESTHHIINKDNIDQFRKGSILVNTARGEIIETKALLTALRSGDIAGVGLDVLEGERELKEEVELLTDHIKNTQKLSEIVADHILIDMPNAIVTPHVAFFTKEACDEIIKTTMENIYAFVESTTQNIIN